MQMYQLEIIEPKAKKLLDELANLNLIKFRPVEAEQKDKIAELRSLLRTTQSLPQAQTITEEEIAAEIAAYREGK